MSLLCLVCARPIAFGNTNDHKLDSSPCLDPHRDVAPDPIRALTGDFEPHADERAPRLGIRHHLQV